MGIEIIEKALTLASCGEDEEAILLL